MYCTLPDGLKVFYTIEGNSKGKPLICLNGLSQSTLTWKILKSRLEKDYQVILIDFIFQGQSDKTPASRSIGEHADDIVHVLNYLDLEKVYLAGISYGSIVCQNLLLRYPERFEKAALLSTFGEKTARFRDIDALLLNSLDNERLDQMFDVLYPFVLGPYFFDNPPIPISQIKQIGMEINDSKSIKRLLTALEAEDDYLPRLHQIKVATMVIHGEFDFLCLPYMAKAVADAIPGSTWELIKDVGHTLNVEANPQICGLLGGFFD